MARSATSRSRKRFSTLSLWSELDPVFRNELCPNVFLSKHDDARDGRTGKYAKYTALGDQKQAETCAHREREIQL
jgi:hypothetical protein